MIKAGSIINDTMSHEDWLPTFLAAAGSPDLKEKLLQGLKVGDKTFKTHLDGYDFMPLFKGEVANGPRREIFYFDDNASLNALRYGDWKITFGQIEGNLFTGRRVTTNVPIVTNLRLDPFERFHVDSGMYEGWWAEKLWAMVPAQTIVVQFLQSFQAYPPSQKSGSISVEGFLEQLQAGAAGPGNDPCISKEPCTPATEV